MLLRFLRRKGWPASERATPSSVLCIVRRQSSSLVAQRIERFDSAKAEYSKVFEERRAALGVIHVQCEQLAAELRVDSAWRPVEALKQIAGANDDQTPVVAALINGRVHGLADSLFSHLQLMPEPPTKPLRLEFVRFGSEEGNRVFWHSSAHVIGAALEATYGPGVQLTDGPAVLDAEGGFFYEMHFTAPDTRISADVFPALEEQSKKLASARHPFERITVDRATAMRMFADNPFKLDMLSKIPAGELITVYRCGPFVDLCRGPHLPHTGHLKHLRLHKSSGAHWQATGKDASIQGALLQRVYGIAFPSSAGLLAWQSRMDQAKARDHRVLGAAQKLIMFHDLSPGSTFLMPHGTRVYNKLLALLRAQYRARGYDEVITPQLYKRGLWRTSGHGAAYADNMYAVTPGLPQHGWPRPPKAAEDHGHSCGHSTDGSSTSHAADPTDDDVFGLKPMNCPGHCLLYAARGVSYRDLPVRLADFSSLHRNEASGALSGLTRVRKFAQDDAHIFCTEQQIQEEVAGCLDFVAAIYGLFGFSFRLKLSTRPEQYVGDLSTWAAAERALASALKAFLASKSTAAGIASTGGGADTSSVQFDVDEGGGAFYGPKIDVFVRDAIGREHQCATVQLDFNLPKRFGLTYRNEEGSDVTPVMIHRAILGSVERFMAVLIEHTAGKWPFWLSPRQVLLCPVADRHIPYARAVAQQLQFPVAAVDGTTIASEGTADTRVIAAHLLGSVRPPAPPFAEVSEASSSPSGSTAVKDGAMHRDTQLYVEVDESTRTVGKKVREGQLDAWNLQVVLGDSEQAIGGAAVRFRDQSTYDAFLAAWGEIDALAANVARKAGSAAADESAREPGKPEQKGAAAGKGKSGKQQQGGHAPAAQAQPSYNSPLVALSVADLRRVCERMLQRYM